MRCILPGRERGLVWKRKGLRNTMDYYEMTIAGVVRRLPLCPISDSMKIGAFVMFGDVELTVAAAKALLERAPEFDVLITAEAKGIPLAYEMARQSGGCRYVVARKVPKLYMRNIFSREVKSITTEACQELFLDGEEAELMKGRRVLIVDDVISTGESLEAVEYLARQAGADIVGRMAVLAEGGARSREDIVALEGLPLFDKDGIPLD